MAPRLLTIFAAACALAYQPVPLAQQPGAARAESSDKAIYALSTMALRDRIADGELSAVAVVARQKAGAVAKGSP